MDIPNDTRSNIARRMHLISSDHSIIQRGGGGGGGLEGGDFMERGQLVRSSLVC